MAKAHDLISKLGIGTVQFGLDYGVSNNEGKTSRADVEHILMQAADVGVCVLDTAHGYGDSEAVVGESLASHQANHFSFVTKTPGFQSQATAREASEYLKTTFEESLKNLQQEHLHALMIHNANDLLDVNADAIFQAMTDLKDQSLIKKIGFSAYDQSQIQQVIQRYDMDIIQVPVNVFDQRLIENGMLGELKKKNIEIHARSAFLQGLIFMDDDNLPKGLLDFQPALCRLDSLCKKYDISRIQAALCFVFLNPYIDHIVCGVNNASQFAELVNTVQNLPDIVLSDDYDNLALHNHSLLNPSHWNT